MQNLPEFIRVKLHVSCMHTELTCFALENIVCDEDESTWWGVIFSENQSRYTYFPWIPCHMMDITIVMYIFGSFSSFNFVVYMCVLPHCLATATISFWECQIHLEINKNCLFFICIRWIESFMANLNIQGELRSFGFHPFSSTFFCSFLLDRA